MKSFKYYMLAACVRAMTYLYKRRGWTTNRHIVVMESDDWGSIRMPSLEVRNELISRGVSIASCIYDKIDTLAANTDLELLMEVLDSVKDGCGNPAKMTLDCVVANPDFERIKANGFVKYEYELFTETLKRYPHHDRVFELWKEGIRHNVFKPQFHGREHLNAYLWLMLLQDKQPEVMKAFDKGVISMDIDKRIDARGHVLAAYNVKNEKERNFVVQSIREGGDLFEQLFGYRSKSMIAPCYIWDDCIEEVAAQVGIQYLQGGIVQTQSVLEKSSLKYHFMGEQNKCGQYYLTRNCFFEPTQDISLGFDRCLHDLTCCFELNKPAIISTHRLNFVGELEVKNRDKNLFEFKQLLQAIVQKYPDVEFMSSDELGDVISMDHNTKFQI